MNNQRQLRVSDSEGVHCMSDLLVKHDCDISHEPEGEFDLYDNASGSEENEYDMGDESERDLGGNGDSDGSLGCRLRTDSESSESGDGGSSLTTL